MVTHRHSTFRTRQSPRISNDVLVLALALALPWGQERVSLSREPFTVDTEILLTSRYEVDVPAEATGRIAEILVEPGDKIAVGQTLAVVDRREAELDVELKKVELARLQALAADDTQVRFAEKARELATKDYERAIAAAKQVPKSVSQAELDRLRLSIDRAEIELERAHRDAGERKLVVKEKELELRVAMLQLEKRVVVSSRAGVIAEQSVELGEWVVAGQPIFRVLSVDQLRGEGMLAVGALPAALRPGELKDAVVEVQVAGEPSSRRGTIEFVAPEANHVTSETRFWVLLDNADGGWHPGMSAICRIRME